MLCPQHLLYQSHLFTLASVRCFSAPHLVNICNGSKQGHDRPYPRLFGGVSITCARMAFIWRN
eukprot:6485083-Amphidinium_carterae.1